jgi:gluconokinase
MGVAGSGKTLVGHTLAQRLDTTFLDADSFHSEANINKMRTGSALEDHDRDAWLTSTCDALIAACSRKATVLACSALKRRYRDRLRAAVPGLRFVFLDVPSFVAQRRVAQRPDHFMPVSLVASQFATLEPPGGEADVLTVDADGPLEELVMTAQTYWLAAMATHLQPTTEASQ